MDTTNYKIQKCGGRRCLTCSYSEDNNSFFSNSTGKRFYPKTGDGHFLNCKSDNIIYLISCKICNLQYVGETKNCLHKRFSNHRSNIRLGKSCQLVHKHFQEDCHGLSNCKIIPIEKIVLNEHDSRILTQAQKQIAIDKIRRTREKYWIATLQTAYPFGLNCRVKGVGDFNPSQGEFLPFGGRRRRKKKRHSRRKPKRLRAKNDISLDFVIGKHRELRNKEGYLHFFKTFLYGLPRVDLQLLLTNVENSVVDIDERLKDLIIMISNFRLFRPVQIVRKNERDFYHLNFRDKGLDFINISRILRNHNVSSKVPIYFNEKEPPIVGYRFNKSIAGQLFNYKEALSEEGIDHFDNNEISCNCQTSPFIDGSHGHVITGNLNIIENETLKNMVRKGPKFRLPQRINWNEDRKIIENFLDTYIDKWISKERKFPTNSNIEKDVLCIWRKTVLEEVDKKITLGRAKFRNNFTLKIEGNVKRELDRLKEKYVITVTDKAQNNILFTCKSFYIAKTKDELNKPGQQTYKLENRNISTLNREIVNFSKQKNINVPDDMQDIPLIYWIPKMHKNPIGSRFIAGSKKCSIKLLSKYFSKALKLILNHMKLYANTVYERSNLNYFWIIENSLDFMDKIKNKSIEHMETYDFSTLYTALPHPEIKRNFSKIFQKVYNREGKQFINVNLRQASFSSEGKNNCCSFRVTDMMEILEFVLDNIFVRYGRKIYKQVVGIPIGLDSGQDIANLLLFSYESEYVEKVSKQDLFLARKFNLCSRYIDDLFVGGFPNFKDHIYKIYPRDLEIKLESNNIKEVSYLDLKIRSEEGRLDFSVYDKRDDFSFEIVNFPFIESCIPKKSALGVFYSQLIRYARICSKCEAFKAKGIGLVTRLKRQGFKQEDLRKIALRFFDERKDLILKYNINAGNDFCKLIF